MWSTLHKPTNATNEFQRVQQSQPITILLFQLVFKHCVFQSFQLNLSLTIKFSYCKTCDFKSKQLLSHNISSVFFDAEHNEYYSSGIKRNQNTTRKWWEQLIYLWKSNANVILWCLHDAQLSNLKSDVVNNTCDLSVWINNNVVSTQM